MKKVNNETKNKENEMSLRKNEKIDIKKEGFCIKLTNNLFRVDDKIENIYIFIGGNLNEQI